MVEQVRRFNRTVTQRVGALDDHFLARERPLGEARVLWEIGRGRVRGAGAAGPARARLGPREPAAARARGRRDGARRGGRARPARPRRAAHGRRAGRAGGAGPAAATRSPSRCWRRSTPEQRERLVGAMRDVERLLTAAMVEIRDGRPRAPGRAAVPALVLRRARAPLRRAVRPADRHHGRAARAAPARRRDGRRLPARRRRSAAARSSTSAARVDRHQADVGRRRGARARARAPAARRRSRRRAARAGARTVRLETNATLVEAIALYRSAGYREVPAFNDEPFADHWFEKRLS